MIFVTLSLRHVGMPKFNVLLLVLLSLYTHVIVNHLKFKVYTSFCDGRVVNASDQGRRGHPVRVSSDPSYKFSTPGC